MRRRYVVVGLALAGIAGARPASADSNDLVLARLTTRTTAADGTLTIIPSNLEFRALASQLGVVLAPHLLSPADTIGYAGFQFTVDTSYTSIDNRAAYWRVLEGSPDPTGTTGAANGPAMMQTVGIFAHKGLWFPVPSLEVGVGAVHLVDSTNWAGQLYAKIGLDEGYHDLPVPSISVRGAVSRLMNERELDLTVASVDVMVSKHVGVAGTWRFDPFVGWNLLAIIPRSQVLDPTPNIDPLAPGNSTDLKYNFTFLDQNNIYRNRILVGAKFQYSVLVLTVEAAFALRGTSIDDEPGTTAACTAPATTVNCDSKDTAAAQQTYSVAAGFEF